MFDDEILNSIKDLIDDETYLVGGYLRNHFINNEISPDRDLVCLKNSYDLALKISQKLDGTLIELDNENEIFRVVLKDKTNYFDISKALENNIIKDIQRRDFTINSIFYNLKKDEIFDPLNGIYDIKNKIIRTYNLKNIDDDYLRLLRLYRFYASTGFNIDKSLNDYVIQNFSKINTIAKERINYEIIQIFSKKFLVKTLLKMLDDGVLEVVFPFVKDVKKVPSNSHHHLDLIHHLIETINQIETNNPFLKVAAFYHDIGKPSTWTIEPDGRHRFIGHDIVGGELVKKELKELNFSNKQIAYISKMVKYHIYPCAIMNSSDNKKAIARFIRKLDDDTLDVIELAKADRLSAQGSAITKEMVEKTLTHLKNLKNYYNEIKSKTSDFKSLLDGREIMEILNIKPSKKVGEILNILKEAQLANEISTKEEAVEFVKKLN